MWATGEARGPIQACGEGAIVNVAPTASVNLAPCRSPEYGAAKAGLIRFTSSVNALDSVRVNDLVPGWVATERVTNDERATIPPPVLLEVVVAGTLRLIADDSLADRVLVLDEGRPPRLLDAGATPPEAA